MDVNQESIKPKDKRLANLRPQKAGEPGHNPNGRPVGSKNRSTIMREWLEMSTDGEPNVNHIMRALIKKASSGDVAAIKEALDSGFGKVADKLEANVKQEPSDHDLSVLKHFVKQNPDILK